MKAMAATRVGFIPTRDSRLVLIAGFGGLLILMAFAGADGIQACNRSRHRTTAFAMSFCCGRKFWNAFAAISICRARTSATTCWNRRPARPRASEALPPLSDMAPLIRAPEGLEPS